MKDWFSGPGRRYFGDVLIFHHHLEYPGILCPGFKFNCHDLASGAHRLHCYVPSFYIPFMQWATRLGQWTFKSGMIRKNWFTLQRWPIPQVKGVLTLAILHFFAMGGATCLSYQKTGHCIPPMWPASGWSSNSLPMYLDDCWLTRQSVWTYWPCCLVGT